MSKNIKKTTKEKIIGVGQVEKILDNGETVLSLDLKPKEAKIILKAALIDERITKADLIYQSKSSNWNLKHALIGAFILHSITDLLNKKRKREKSN